MLGSYDGVDVYMIDTNCSLGFGIVIPVDVLWEFEGEWTGATSTLGFWHSIV